MSAVETPFLGQLGSRDAEELMQQLRRRTVRKSEPILRAGAAGDDVVLVLSGHVKLVAYGADKREVVLAIRGRGELIGEMAALAGQRRTATVVAVDDVEVGYLAADELKAFLAGHPDVALVLIRMLVRRLSEADRDRVDLATQDSVGMVAKRLLELSVDHGTPRRHRDADRVRVDAGRARKLDGSHPRDRLSRAAADAPPGLDRDRPPVDHGPRPRRAAPALRRGFGPPLGRISRQPARPRRALSRPTSPRAQITSSLGENHAIDVICGLTASIKGCMTRHGPQSARGLPCHAPMRCSTRQASSSATGLTRHAPRRPPPTPPH